MQSKDWFDASFKYNTKSTESLFKRVKNGETREKNFR